MHTARHLEGQVIEEEPVSAFVIPFALSIQNLSQPSTFESSTFISGRGSVVATLRR